MGNNTYDGRSQFSLKKFMDIVAKEQRTPEQNKAFQKWFINQQKEVWDPMFVHPRIEETKRNSMMLERMDKTYQEHEAAIKKRSKIKITTQSIHAVYQYLETWNFNKKGLFIFGPPGQGKTTAKEVFETMLTRSGLINNKIYFSAQHSCADIVEMLKDYKTQVMYKGVSMSRQDFAIKRCIEADILFLDDLGAHDLNDKLKQQFFQIMDAREKAHERLGKATFFTSNLTPKQVEEMFGSRIIDRIISMVTFRNMDNGTGKSFRRLQST